MLKVNYATETDPSSKLTNRRSPVGENSLLLQNPDRVQKARQPLRRQGPAGSPRPLLPALQLRPLPRRRRRRQRPVRRGVHRQPRRHKLIDVAPVHHKFDLPDAKLVAPGHPERSILLHRLSHRGPGQMPQLATNLVDEKAVKVVEEWIKSLGKLVHPS